MTKPKKPEDKKPKTEWKPIWLVMIYKYARAGMSDLSIMKTLGIASVTWHRWMRVEGHMKPELAEALQIARSETSQTLADYMFRRLPEPVKDVWSRMVAWEEEPNGIVKIEQILSDHGVAVRQQLFLHALMSSSYSPSWACAKVNIDHTTYELWIDKDPNFAQMVKDIEWHKKNFFEECLTDLVAARDTTAVIFANKTINRDRGFGQHVNVEVSGTVMHGVLDMAELIPYMSKEVQEGLLEAIHKRDDALTQTKGRPVPVEKMLEADIAKLPEMIP